jgi:hypothetical protein
VKRETELQPGAGNTLATELLRLSPSHFRGRVLAMWERILRLSRRTPKRLRLCESLPLGERRFVAVVEFEQNRFLLGGTPSSLVLLSRLEDADDKKRNDSEEQPRGGTC